MDTVVLALRVLLSLAVVLGLLWVIHRRMARHNLVHGKANPVTVISRQGISPKASLVIIEADGKRFMLGVTEQSVNVLHTSEAGAVALSPVSSVSPAFPASAVPPVDMDRVGTARMDTDNADAFANVLQLETGTHGQHERVPDPMGSPERRTGRRSMGGASGGTGGTDGANTAAPASSALSGSAPSGSMLSGSILSPDTWKQTARAIRQGRSG